MLKARFWIILIDMNLSFGSLSCMIHSQSIGSYLAEADRCSHNLLRRWFVIVLLADLKSFFFFFLANLLSMLSLEISGHLSHFLAVCGGQMHIPGRLITAAVVLSILITTPTEHMGFFMPALLLVASA